MRAYGNPFWLMTAYLFYHPPMNRESKVKVLMRKLFSLSVAVIIKITKIKLFRFPYTNAITFMRMVFFLRRLLFKWRAFVCMFCVCILFSIYVVACENRQKCEQFFVVRAYRFFIQQFSFIQPPDNSTPKHTYTHIQNKNVGSSLVLVAKTVYSSWNNWKLLRKHHTRFKSITYEINRHGEGDALDEAIKTVCQQIVNGKSRKNSAAMFIGLYICVCQSSVATWWKW